MTRYVVELLKKLLPCLYNQIKKGILLDFRQVGAIDEEDEDSLLYGCIRPQSKLPAGKPNCSKNNANIQKSSDA